MSAVIQGGAFYTPKHYTGWYEATFTVEDDSATPLPDRRVVIMGQRPLSIIGVKLTNDAGQVAFQCLPNEPDNMFIVAFDIEGQTKTADVSDRLISLTQMSTVF